MAIRFTCSCGQELETEEAFAGRQVQCPTCKNLVTAPSPEDNGSQSSLDELGLPDQVNLVPIDDETPHGVTPKEEIEKSAGFVKEESWELLPSESPTEESPVVTTPPSGEAKEPPAVIRITAADLVDEPAEEETETATAEVVADAPTLSDVPAPTAEKPPLPPELAAPKLKEHITAQPGITTKSNATTGEPLAVAAPMPILDDEEPAGSGWYDAKAVPVEPVQKRKKKKKKKFDFDERHRELKAESDALTRVSSALATIYLTVPLMFLGYIVGLGYGIYMALTISEPGGGSDTTLETFMAMGFSLIHTIVCALILMNAMIFAKLPVKFGTKPYAVLAVAFVALALLVFGGGFVYFLADVLGGPFLNPTTGRIIAGAIIGAGLGSYVTGIVFFLGALQAFAEYVEEPGVAHEARMLVPVWLWSTLLGPFLIGIFNVILFFDFYLFLGCLIFYVIIIIAWVFYFAFMWVRWLNMIGVLRKVLVMFYDK